MNKQSILLTGGAGFIGSHILDALLRDERVHHVRVLDDLSTGRRENIAASLDHPQCEFVLGDIREEQACIDAVRDMDRVCHQAALGSVPRSIEDPQTTHAVNATGSLNVFRAAREEGIKRIVFASSSAVYGDEEGLPKREAHTGHPLSPYAVSKQSNEAYARVFSLLWDMELIGLRYFNVFGPRQNPEGPYAAVIPKFINRLFEGKAPVIYGDGEQSRDFTYVDLAVQANINSIFTGMDRPGFIPLNIACGQRIRLNELYDLLLRLTGKEIEAEYAPPRAGDIRHSLADISEARERIGYRPEVELREGLKRTVEYFEATTFSS